MLTPQKIQADVHEHHQEIIGILKANPWLAPTLTALHMIPVTVAIYGCYKTRALNKQLKIEREKTKRQALKHLKKVQPINTDDHTHCCPKPLPVLVKQFLQQHRH
ncbi:transposase [Lactiplantibacillus modestisalitolerans]|uniref:Transposase n=1 Tax=Lactiplantibacillus modestisalitolerans TaxID=1457219 RepID=A0ABV5WRW1_9LACO|nr:transposase [Lactiplantibacillus modestisalitolerans]